MTDKQIIGGRGSAKSYTTLNTIEVMLENEKLKEALKAKEQKFGKAKLLLQTIIETNKIYPLQNNLLKLLDIMEGNENE